MRCNHALRLISKRVQNRVHRYTTSSLSSHRTIISAASTLPLAVGNSKTSSNNAIRHHKTNQRAPCRATPQQPRRYGSRAFVELEEQTFRGMEAIQPYIRSSLSSDEDTCKESMNMEFAISFLGTGGGAPTMHRNGSCTVLRLGGQSYLFDACEGTIRQLQFSRILPTTITKIFISHLHGDHVYGLVPVLLGLSTSHKAATRNLQKKRKHNADHLKGGGKPTVEIYGPPGLYNYICMMLALSCAKMNHMNVDVVELVGGKQEQGPMATRPKSRGRRNVFLSHYPEVDMPLLKRRYLTANEDNVWIIDEPDQINQDMIQKGISVNREDGFHRLPNDINLGTKRRLHIKAAELDHVGGVQTFGYTVEEQTPPGNIDMEKAKALGIKPSKKYGILKCGLSVPTDDGTGEVHPDQVIVETFKPRKFAMLADHRFVPPPMAELCRNADFLVHEATLSRDAGIDIIKMRGHNTAYNAGLFGKNFGCKVVALNHFGNSGIGRDFVGGILAESRAGNQYASEMIASYDFMEVWVPRGGFKFDGKKADDSGPPRLVPPGWDNSQA